MFLKVTQIQTNTNQVLQTLRLWSWDVNEQFIIINEQASLLATLSGNDINEKGLNLLDLPSCWALWLSIEREYDQEWRNCYHQQLQPVSSTLVQAPPSHRPTCGEPRLLLTRLLPPSSRVHVLASRPSLSMFDRWRRFLHCRIPSLGHWENRHSHKQGCNYDFTIIKILEHHQCLKTNVLLNQ